MTTWLSGNLIRSTGATHGTRYELLATTTRNSIPLSPSLEEHIVWDNFVAPHLRGLPENALNVCNYAFTEMCNNAIDHSNGAQLVVSTKRDALNVTLTVADDGIGIFRKIRQVSGLDDERAAILELSKGKLTTDSAKHTSCFRSHEPKPRILEYLQSPHRTYHLHSSLSIRGSISSSCRRAVVVNTPPHPLRKLFVPPRQIINYTYLNYPQTPQPPPTLPSPLTPAPASHSPAQS